MHVDDARRELRRALRNGLILFGIGFVITVGTLVRALTGGGVYFVLFGPLIVGGSKSFKAYSRLRRLSAAPDGVHIVKSFVDFSPPPSQPLGLRRLGRLVLLAVGICFALLLVVVVVGAFLG
jgi:hypothetical protein